MQWLRREDSSKFKASLGYVAQFCFKSQGGSGGRENGGELGGGKQVWEEKGEKERKIKLALTNLMTLLYSDKSLMSSS